MDECKDTLIGAVVCSPLGVPYMLLAQLKISMEHGLKTSNEMEWTLGLERSMKLTDCGTLDMLLNISEPSFLNLNNMRKILNQ